MTSPTPNPPAETVMIYHRVYVIEYLYGRAWRPIDVAYGPQTARRALKAHKDADPSAQFRMRLYVPAKEAL